jgi:hypothetical protein
VRYARAVQKLRELTDACERVKGWPPEDPFLVEAYVFGDLLQGVDPLEAVQVALVLNLPADQVPWESHPHGTDWLADELRVSKGGFAYWWRSCYVPVWNHHIRCPVRFWSQDGPQHEVLDALAQRRLETLPRIVPPEEEQRRQQESDLAEALAHLRAIHASYWDREWRRDHRGSGRYPEHHLWEAVEGYLDVLHAFAHPRR